MVTQQRPFRFGVIGEHVRSREELERTVRRAEDLGCATFLLRDHFIAEPFGDQLAPIAALMVAAQATTRLRVGSLVLDNDYRHPVVLAKEAATLDLLSDGRFELGLGCGWLRAEYDQAGMPFEEAKVRVDRLEEAIRVLKGLFADEPLTFAGHHYTVSGLDGFPKPVQRPHPPILIGAGSKRMLQIAGREADCVGILAKALPDGTISEDVAERLPEALERKVAWIRDAAGSRFPQIELSMVISVLLTDDRRAQAEQVARRRGWDGVSPEQVLSMPSLYIGSHEEVVEEMHRRRERYGVSYFVASDADMETLAPLVAAVAGR
jgi:probable F420-dependent oxidoreductase